MSEDSKEIARFAFGMRMLRNPNGIISFEDTSLNQGIPEEIVIMHLKFALRNMENKYFKKMDDSTSSLDGGTFKKDDE